MNKYFQFARIAFFDHLRNRVRHSTRFMMFMILSWVMISLWQVIYKNGMGPPSIKEHDMFWYNGLAQMMVFLSPRIFAVIDEDVRSGNIGYFLNRPMPYIWMRFSEGAGALFGNILIYYLLGIPFIYFLVGVWPSQGASMLAPAAFLLAMGSILHLLFQIACGLSAFWFDDALFVYHIYQKILILLGGLYMPLVFYPSFLDYDVIRWLPFSTMVYQPSAFVLGSDNAPAFWEVVTLQGLWLAVIVAGLSLMYGICLRKVEVHGG